LPKVWGGALIRQKKGEREVALKFTVRNGAESQGRAQKTEIWGRQKGVDNQGKKDVH